MIKPLNVLFISYDGMTDPLGQSQVIPYMQGLTKAGFRITILSCEKPQIYKEKKAFIEKVLNDSGIEWVPLSYTKHPPVISTIYDTWRLKRAARKIHWQQKIQLVHTRSGTPVLVGHWLKRKFGIKFLHDIRDFYADSRVDSGSWDQRSLLYRMVYRYLKRAESAQLKDSDGVVCLTYAAEKILKNSAEFSIDKPLAVIPCSVDLDLFDPNQIDQQKKDSLMMQLGIVKGDIIISYLGSIGGWYLVQEMMQFFAVLLKQKPNAKFLFITPHLHEYISQNAKQYGVPADKIISVKGIRNEIPLLLSLSDYSIFFIKPCYSKQASSPTKHGELMAMGIPVITNTGVGDLEMIIDKYSGGILVDEFSQNAFEEAIYKMSTSEYDKGLIRRGAREFYALQEAVEKYKRIYRQILGVR